MNRLRLALVFHDHQPIGNFDGVFEGAYQDSYAPLLELLKDYPDLPMVLHTSGSLLEWLVANHPEYIERVREFAERGQLEILGGPFYEPIMSCIPRRDRIGQISMYTEYLERHFGTRNNPSQPISPTQASNTRCWMTSIFATVACSQTRCMATI
jgi:alpha-amylase/alpha-mannosidase (GH57 family)